MKIVHATSVHPWNDTRIFTKMAASCAREGYETHLVAIDRDSSEVRIFKHNDVTVHLLPGTDINGRYSRMVVGGKRVAIATINLNPDVIHFHDPELLLRFSNTSAKVIYDVHEDLPRQISTKEWIPSIFRPLYSSMAEIAENIGARYMDLIIAATPTIAARFPVEKTITVRNYPLPEELRSPSGEPYHLRDPIFVYVGGISAERGFSEMIAAAETVATNRSIDLFLAGRITDELLQRLDQHKPHTTYCGLLDRHDVASLLGRARAGLCVLHPTQNYPDALPVKLFEYMAAGIPVIASNFPLWRKIVEENDCGLCVDPLHPWRIAEAMNWILDNPKAAEDMGKRGQAAVISQYNWHQEVKQLISAYAITHPAFSPSRQTDPTTLR